MPEVLAEGDKLLISHRRLFEEDELRYFVGTVTAYADGVVKVTGNTYLRDFTSGEVVAKDDIATKVYSLSSGTIIVYELPAATNLGELKFVGDARHLVLTDGYNLKLDLSEHYQEAGFRDAAWT